ncbi:MAG: hypothetical protein Q9187_004750 [Circinaria calcarea]
MRSSLLSRTWQRTHRRGAAGAIAVTVPTCWYLLQPDPNKSHGHGHEEGHGEHDGGEEHEDVHEEAHDITEDEQAEQNDEAPANDEQTESTGDEGNDAEAPSNEDKGQETPDTSDGDDEPKNVEHETDNGGDVEGVQFKGAAKLVNEDPGQGDVRKHIPDAKGGNKKRIESKYGNRLGLNEEGDDKSRLTDKAAASKTPGDLVKSQSGKQAGLSNTDTKHPSDPVKDPDKSLKGENAPETAKLQGSVDPTRPQK